MRLALFVLISSSAALLAACPGKPPMTAASVPTSLDDQIANGGALYKDQCASCHGDNGEGRDAPALIGPKGLDEFKHARQAFNYMREHMPPDSPGSLGDQGYWNVVAFLVKRNDIPVSDIVTPANAESITWNR
jgi:mono/diheme cytochrome c family protein